jgi:tetrahedral aminopeptidase
VSSIDLDLLKLLCETPGIPGREAAIRRVVLEKLAPLVDETSVDPLGNVIGLKRGSGGPKVMVAAHMDEIGFFVSHIDDSGFIRLHPVGGFDARLLPAQRVIIHGQNSQTFRGVIQFSGKPIHLLDSSEMRPPKVEDLFVDVGMPADEVRSSIEVGDMVTMDRSLEVVGEAVVSKSLDDRVGVYVMIEALRRAGDVSADIYAVATTQEEVGLRGARTAAFSIEPDISVALDITLAMDIPDSKNQHVVTKLGAGPGIKIMDSSVISHPGLLQHFRDISAREEIPYQLELLPRGGTDAGATQLIKGGNVAITLSIPARYAHSVNEMARIDDIEATTKLLAAFFRDAGSRSYDDDIVA